MKIAVFGLGYVGMTSAACLAHQGHQVLGVDTNEEKVEIVNSGRSPITEPGLPELVEKAVSRGLLCATTDAKDQLNSCAMAIVCVGTPSAPDGSHDMKFIIEVTRQIATCIGKTRDEVLTVVYRSTVRPGTMEELIQPIFEQFFGNNLDNVELVYNPEFLRESIAISDFFNPPKIVIGTKDAKPCRNLELINSGLQAPVFYTNYREAEITKFVDNSFHALKIAFANEIGRVCVKLGINTELVHKIFISDTKLNISSNYLRPGGPFGGSCLPKDVRALQHLSGDIGAHTHLIDSILRSNEAHKHFAFELCSRHLRPGSKILMLGLSFKLDSDDLRESPNVDLARKLLQAGYNLSIHDPCVEPEKLIGQNLGYAFSHLPVLQKVLISREQAESEQFDLVIDTRSIAHNYCLKTDRILDINVLRQTKLLCQYAEVEG